MQSIFIPVQFLYGGKPLVVPFPNITYYKKAITRLVIYISKPSVKSIPSIMNPAGNY
jgi:hypothetical protein